MPFSGILGGFKTRQKQFFAYFWSQKKNKKKIPGKIGDFLFSDFSTAKSFSDPPKSDFSSKNRPISAIFLSLGGNEQLLARGVGKGY